MNARTAGVYQLSVGRMGSRGYGFDKEYAKNKSEAVALVAGILAKAEKSENIKELVISWHEK